MESNSNGKQSVTPASKDSNGENHDVSNLKSLKRTKKNLENSGGYHTLTAKESEEDGNCDDLSDDEDEAEEDSKREAKEVF